MDMILLIAVVLLISMVGTVLFRLAAERVAEVQREAEAADSTEIAGVKSGGEALVGQTAVEKEVAAAVPTQPGETKLPRWAILSMFAVNVALALFMRLFYNAALLTIANTVMLCAVLWPCAWSDRKAFVIPNRVLLVGLLSRGVLLAAQCLVEPESAGYYLIRSALAAVVLIVICTLCRLLSSNALGLGDLKLMGLMGFFLGTDMIWEAMLFSMLSAFVYSLVLLITRKATRKTEIPFAPLLLTGTVLAAFLTSI